MNNIRPQPGSHPNERYFFLYTFESAGFIWLNGLSAVLGLAGLRPWHTLRQGLERYPVAVGDIVYLLGGGCRRKPTYQLVYYEQTKPVKQKAWLPALNPPYALESLFQAETTAKQVISLT